MNSLEWLDAVRTDLAAATPGPWRAEWDDADKWHSITGAGHDLGGGLWMVCPEVATVGEGGDSDARLIASAPDRLDRMERALRTVLEICEGLAYENARTTPREYVAQARAEVADTIQEAIGEALR